MFFTESDIDLLSNILIKYENTKYVKVNYLDF